MTIGTDTAYALPVINGPVVHDVFGKPLSPVKVEWRTYLYDGQAYRLVIAYAENSNNRQWNLSYDEVPEWVPTPPTAWFVLAEGIAAQAVQS